MACVAAPRAASFFGWVCTSGALLLTTLLVAPRTQAQVIESQPMQPGRGMVLTRVSVGQRPFAVFFGRGRLPIAACEGECAFWAWPGKYRVIVQRGEGPRDNANLALRVRTPGSYTFVPANGGAQNAGLILGISGPVIGLAGLVLWGAGYFATCPNRPGEHCHDTLTYVGFGGFLAGGAMTAVGWPVYLHNRARFEFNAQTAAQPRPQPLARLGVVPLPRGGVGLGATLAF